MVKRGRSFIPTLPTLLIILVIFCFSGQVLLGAGGPCNTIGDINADNVVNMNDLAILASYWLQSSCSDANGWCGCADIDGNGRVDFADFSTIAVNWLQTKSTALELYPTINCVGIRLSYSGNPQHMVEYRLAGTPSWKVGHHLTAITNNRLVGSLFWLKPNSIYQVRITIGSQVFTGQVRTRADSPLQSVGATYCVSTDGNDANPGTGTNPFATISKAAGLVQAGYTVIVRSGIYRESINMTASGTLANPIHFKSQTPLGAVIDGGGSTTVPIVKFTGVSNIILEGFTLQNAGDAVVLNNAYDCWITGNAINCTDEGIMLIKNTASNNVIQYNQIRDTTPGGRSSGGNSGVELEGGRGNIIRYNDVNGFSNGISAGRLFDLGLIDDETINPDIDVYGNVVYNIGDDALEPEGCCINNRLWDNQLYDSFVAISLAPIGVGPAFIIRNTCFESTPIKFHLTLGCGPAYVYHYTSFKGTGGGYGLKTHNLGSERDVVFRNCIFHSADSYVLYGPGGDLDYNLYFFTGSTLPFQWGTDYYATLQAFQAATGEELHGLLTDPCFVDAWGKDFSLQPSSPARNAGIYIPGINDDYKGTAPDIGAVEFQENGKPVVNAGSDQSIVDPNNSVTLNGTVTDDGLPNPPGTVTVHWTQQSGPGSVTFGDANSVNTTAIFAVGAVGQYVLRLTANDSNLSGYDEVTVTYYPSNTLNQAPVVDAGTDQTITPPDSANLDGTVTDDGLPNPPGAVTTTWIKTSGPGTVTFGDIHAVDTTASFAMSGSYVLRLTADDGALQAYDEVNITVNQPVNQAPSVNAGTDQTITLPASANLDGTVTDDGFPNPPGVVTTLWTKQGGPGTVTFGDANAVATTATFSTFGTYVLRLAASDSDLESYDEVTITVNPPPASCQFVAGTATGWNLNDANVVLQTIYGNAQDSAGNITANSGHALQNLKGFAMAFNVPSDTTLDKGTFKINGATAGKTMEIRLFNVTGKGYLTTGHTMSRSDPGSGSSAFVDVTVNIPSTVPYHTESTGTQHFTDMVINFGPVTITSGDYLLTFDCIYSSSTSLTTACNIDYGTGTQPAGMGLYPNGTPLPKRATITSSASQGNTYWYNLNTSTDTNYSHTANMFVFQMQAKND